jgi:hypothetical protein
VSPVERGGSRKPRDQGHGGLAEIDVCLGEEEGRE